MNSGAEFTDFIVVETGSDGSETDEIVVEVKQPISSRFGVGDKLAPDDLFDLTMISETAKNYVSVNQIMGITRLIFNSGQFVVCVANRDFDNDETKLEVKIVKKSRGPGKLKKITSFFHHKMMRKTTNRTINGVEYEIEKTNKEEYGVDLTFDGISYRCLNSRRQFSIFTNDTSSAYNDLLRHIFDVFPNKTPLFFLDLRGIRAENFVISQDLLCYEQVIQTPCLAMGVRCNEFVEQAHTILESMIELKNLNLDIELEDMEFFHPRMSSIDHLTVHYFKNQISEDNFLSLNCETIKLWSANVSPKSLNFFIKQWLLTESRRLRHLEIPILCLDPEEKQCLDEVFDGLTTIPFDGTRRVQFYKKYDWNYELNCTGPQRFINCSSGKDIYRQDGLLATVLVSSSFFYLLVWHDRFPDQPNRNVPYVDD